MEIVFFIVGLLFAGIGGYMLWDARRFARRAVKGEGLVIGFAVNERRGKSGNRTTYSPVIRYRHQGEDYQFTGRIGSSHVKRSIGDPAAILISPDDPAEARLDGPGTQIFGAIFLVLGLGTMAVFFTVFEFSLLSLVIAGGVIAALAFQVKSKLRRHDIHGLEDMKSALAAAGQGRRPEAAGEASRTVITDPEVFDSRRKKHKTPGWVLVLVLLIGLGVLAGGGYVAKQRGEFLSEARPATGEVIDFKRRTSTSDGKTKTTWYPVVRYQPAGREAPVTFRHDTGSSSPAYRRGESVTVLYTPGDPGQAIIDEGLMNWLGPGVMILVGGVFTLAGGLGVRSRLKQRRREPEEVELEF